VTASRCTGPLGVTVRTGASDVLHGLVTGRDCRTSTCSRHMSTCHTCSSPGSCRSRKDSLARTRPESGGSGRSWALLDRWSLMFGPARAASSSSPSSWSCLRPRPLRTWGKQSCSSSAVSCWTSSTGMHGHQLEDRVDDLLLVDRRLVGLAEGAELLAHVVVVMLEHDDGISGHEQSFGPCGQVRDGEPAVQASPTHGPSVEPPLRSPHPHSLGSSGPRSAPGGHDRTSYRGRRRYARAGGRRSCARVGGDVVGKSMGHRRVKEEPCRAGTLVHR